MNPLLETYPLWTRLAFAMGGLLLLIGFLGVLFGKGRPLGSEMTNVFLVIFTLALVITGVMQWQIVRQTLQTSERAWVTVKEVVLVKGLILGQKPVAKVQVINSGRSPAVEAVVAGALFSRSTLPDNLLDVPGGESHSRMLIGPNAEVIVLLDTTEPVARQEQIEAIRAGDMHLFANGFITYKDIFDRSHRTSFCFVLRETDVAGAAFAACDRGNAAD